MKVVHLIDTLALGGAQKLLVTFATAAQRRGLPATVISLRSDTGTSFPAEIQARGGRVFMFGFRRLAEPVKFWRLWQFMRQEHFDLIHSHLTHANILAPVLGLLLGIPVVEALHSAELRDKRYYKPALDRLEVWSLRYGAKRIHAVGTAVAAAHRPRLAGRPIEVIANAFTPMPASSPELRSKIRAQLMPDPAGIFLLAIGRLELQKGYSDLLEAFAVVHQTHPRAYLAIAGDGSELASLKAQTNSLGLNGQAVLLGLRSDIPDLLGAADLYVLSSHWEGMPVALLEAMAAGLASVATEVGDVPTALAEGTGLVVPAGMPGQLAQAISSLIENPERRTAMGIRAREVATNSFTMDQWMDRLQNMYAQVTGQP